REKLGLAKDPALILTIAAGYKFTPLEDNNFLDLHVPLLQKMPNLLLWAVGPKGDAWTIASVDIGGRVRALGTVDDVSMFYSAADVYIDSFPFASLTSLL